MKRGPSRHSDANREARVAGLRNFATPTLEAVERRRWQLWIFAGGIIVALSGGMVLLSLDNAPIRLLETILPGYIIRVLLVGFSSIIGFYLLDKESRLKKLTRDLIDERVLSAALSNRLKELSILSEVGKAINQVLDVEDVLRMILRSAVDLLEAEEGSIMLAEDGSDELVVAYAHTSRDVQLEGLRARFGEGVSGWVAQNREPLLITGDAKPEFFKTLGVRKGTISSALSVPLIGQDELYGVLNVNDVTGERRFSEYDLRALGLFAEHAAIAIRNARTFEQEKQALIRLEEVDRMKTEFIATVSHELRTPLTSIIGCAKTIRRRGEALSDMQRQEFLEMIERQGERLLRMVEEILSASRIESGHDLHRREEVELVNVAQLLVKQFETSGAKNPIRLDSPPSVIAFGDPMAFEQILSNLIENAVKYSDSDAPVDVILKEEPGVVEVQVRDEGRGVPASELPTIFDRFHQVDQSSTRKAGGVGLGLYLVLKLVEASGGSIAVESVEGVGSTFTAKFPKRREQTTDGAKDPDR